MATVSITLTDVVVDGVPRVRMKTDWSSLTSEDTAQPTQAMFAAKDIEYLYAAGQISAQRGLDRMLAAATPTKEG